MVRTATLDLNSRGSFVDDLNSKPGIVMCRDALLHRSHEIQPAFFDSERKNKLVYFFRLRFTFIFIFSWDLTASCLFRGINGLSKGPVLRLLLFRLLLYGLLLFLQIRPIEGVPRRKNLGLLLQIRKRTEC